MALTDSDRLRQMLGESIPPGGTAADTMFTAEMIEDFLDRADGDLNEAAYLGWVAKAGMVSNLVDTQEGQAREALSDLHDHALKQITFFGNLIGLGGASRSTRIRTLRRS